MTLRPCEYCGAALPEGVDRGTRRQRSFHFAACPSRPRQPPPPSAEEALSAILAAEPGPARDEVIERIRAAR